MKYKDIEEYLSRFTIKGPEDGLRHEVLLKAKSAWTSSKVFSFKFNLSGFARGYAYVFGLVLLVSMVSSRIDSVLTNNLLDGKTVTVRHIEETNDMESLYIELGFEYETGRLLARMMFKEQDVETQINMFEQREQIMKELKLTNGGLS